MFFLTFQISSSRYTECHPSSESRKLIAAYTILLSYHHGKQQYNHAETFKEVCVDAFVSESSGKDKLFFRGKILELIPVLRTCYEQLDGYNDETLAWLILHDVCFFIYFLDAYVGLSSSWETKRSELFNHFGLGKIHFIGGDLFLLENLIPIWIIKLLLCLQSNEGDSFWDELLLQFMNDYLFTDERPLEVYPCDHEPFHFRHFYTAS